MAARSVEIAVNRSSRCRAAIIRRLRPITIFRRTAIRLICKTGASGTRSVVWEVGARATWDAFQWGTTYYADKEAGWLVTKMRYAEEDLKLSVGQ